MGGAIALDLGAIQGLPNDKVATGAVIDHIQGRKVVTKVSAVIAQGQGQDLRREIVITPETLSIHARGMHRRITSRVEGTEDRFCTLLDMAVDILPKSFGVDLPFLISSIV